jgi:transcriptional regulator with XRE-family HTH domain
MVLKVDYKQAEKPRAIAKALADSKDRGSPIATLVQRLESDDNWPGKISSAAFRAGDLVRTIRKEAGFSQAALASRIGVKQARISEIEAGAGSQGPTWDLMERIAAACGRRIVLDKLQEPNVSAEADHRPLFDIVIQAMRQFPLEATVSSWSSHLSQQDINEVVRQLLPLVVQAVSTSKPTEEIATEPSVSVSQISPVAPTKVYDR